MVLSKNAQFEGGGTLSRDNAATISDAPGLARDNDSKPIISDEVLSYAMATKKSDGFDAFVSIRGIGPKGLALRPEISFVSGRMFHPGKYELIVGAACNLPLKGLQWQQVPLGRWLDYHRNIHGAMVIVRESELLTEPDT